MWGERREVRWGGGDRNLGGGGRGEMWGVGILGGEERGEMGGKGMGGRGGGEERGEMGGGGGCGDRDPDSLCNEGLGLLTGHAHVAVNLYLGGGEGKNGGGAVRGGPGCSPTPF